MSADRQYKHNFKSGSESLCIRDDPEVNHRRQNFQQELKNSIFKSSSITLTIEFQKIILTTYEKSRRADIARNTLTVTIARVANVPRKMSAVRQCKFHFRVKKIHFAQRKGRKRQFVFLSFEGRTPLKRLARGCPRLREHRERHP
jgi:hypothetical protein